MMKRLAGAVAATALALTATVGLSTEKADAWWWSSHVKVAGNISCQNQGVYPHTVTIRLNNGAVNSATANWLRNYGMWFYNVPSGGTGGTAWVTCSTWTGTRTFTRPVWVFRPALGEQISINFSG